MIISIKMKKLLLLLIVISIIAFLAIKSNKNDNNAKWSIGGIISVTTIKEDYKIDSIDENYSERYHRPSKVEPLNDKYNFSDFDNKNIITAKDTIFAYYGILKDASNMGGYSGGCGTIGEAKAPYETAYSLLSTEYKSRLTEKKFEDSFKGIGHISLLNVYPLSTEEHKYFIEIEYITGKNTNEDSDVSYFGYYYGTITIIKENNKWKINEIIYHPENFLCAPYHSWFYDANLLVGIVYINNLKKIDKITGYTYDEKTRIVNVYGTKKDKKYRFDFIRLTNGYDILMQENLYLGGKYIPINIIDNTDWESFKLK